MGSRPGGRARSDGGRGPRGPRGRFTARSVPALLLLATGSLLLHLLLAGPAPPGAAAQPQPGALLPGPEAGRARPLPRCATALVASDACRVRPADGKLVFRDPTVTVQRDGREAVEMRPRKFALRYERAQMTNFAGRAVDAPVDLPAVEVLVVIGIELIPHSFIMQTCGVYASMEQGLGPLWELVDNYCARLAFNRSKKRSGTPKLVFKLPEVNRPDLDALAPESPGACTMQFRTPCDEDAESDVRD